MYSSSQLILFVVLLIVFDTAWIAFFRRMKQGKFELKSTGKGRFMMLTNTGRFSVDEKAQVLVYRESGKLIHVKFSDIEGIEYRGRANYAFLQELFFGFSFFDLFSEYHDKMQWFSLSIRTVDQGDIPIYIAGQYRPRDFLINWYIELQARFLTSIGLFHDVSEYSNTVQETVRERFRKAGINSHLVARKR